METVIYLGSEVTFEINQDLEHDVISVKHKNGVYAPKDILSSIGDNLFNRGVFDEFMPDTTMRSEWI